jgi:uncharacterized membrane protein
MQNPPPNPSGSQSGATQGKSSVGNLDGNVAALLAYVATWLSGLIFYMLEKENRFVRFHAMQAIMLGGVAIVLMIILGTVWTIAAYISWILGSLVGLVCALIWLVVLVAWVMCMVKAYQGQQFKLPIIGDIAENMINK